MTCYSARQGLLGDEIFEILEDEQGWLWLSCPKGVFRVRKHDFDRLDAKEINSLPCVVYGKEDGLATVRCSGVGKPAAWKSRDGRFWFATTKGLAVVNPNSDLNLNGLAPPVYIEELLADKKAVTEEAGGQAGEGPAASLPSARRLAVPPGRRELEVHYTALSLQVPEKVRFKYKVEGIDAGWIDAGTKRVATYDQVPPGAYRFRVIGCNNDGVWNETGAELAFIVQQFFWQTAWFRAGLAALLLLMVVLASYLVSTRRLQHQMRLIEQQHAMEQERSRIARDIHDDMGAQVTEILLLNDLARKHPRHTDEVEKHLRKQSEVAREVARSLDRIVWAVTPANDSLPRLANYLSEQVEMFLSSSAIRCRLDVPDALPNCFVLSEFRHNIMLTVKESLNNVVKHAQATEVLFRLAVDAAGLAITLEDNGRGFAPLEVASRGNGLQNMQKRIADIGGAFTLASTPGQGTRIAIRIPLQSQLPRPNPGA